MTIDDIKYEPPVIEDNDLDGEWYRVEMDFPNEPWFEGRRTLASCVSPLWEMLEYFGTSYWEEAWYA